MILFVAIQEDEVLQWLLEYRYNPTWPFLLWGNIFISLYTYWELPMVQWRAIEKKVSQQSTNMFPIQILHGFYFLVSKQERKYCASVRHKNITETHTLICGATRDRKWGVMKIVVK